MTYSVSQMRNIVEASDKGETIQVLRQTEDGELWCDLPKDFNFSTFSWDYAVRIKPKTKIHRMTNLEKIRQSTEEDWIEFIENRPCDLCPRYLSCPLGCNCEKEIRAWLNSEVEE